MKEFKVGDIVKYNGNSEVYFKVDVKYTVTEVDKRVDGIGIKGYVGLWNPAYFTLASEVKHLPIKQLREAKKQLESEILNFVSSKVAEFQKVNNVEIDFVNIWGEKLYMICKELAEWIPDKVEVRIEV